ncbi:head-to-tail connector complex protein [Gordonia phage Schmidt]|uniref:Head-to-tail connector complex protein n=1 Tax=Gordonia phage Schmidt TaxID=2301697 RepID=A0A385E2Q8_9CAUD|nr:head-to-tail connector complex protein [Gordonia phage Schmidt]AXQ65132.1 head-to-tail connector complex protein [Gordonia phage Schmidt]
MPDILTGADLERFTDGEVVAGAQADMAVEGALAAVRTYCQWHVLGERTETLVLNGSGTQELTLPTTRVVEVLEVREDGELLPERAWSWSADGALRKRVGCWSDEFRSVEVKLTHGHETAPDVVRVVLALAARNADNPLARKSEAVGSMSFGRDAVGGFFADEYRQLDPYRAVV